ncbi:MAG: DNRLRE domain-containing protein [Rhodocyclaceae bacterium]|nr:DNRLRE domain-containing protein [Rhodocyclaceae bacterium]MBX3668081.1 DNRLRE domain-containing protein [Rhodocyclaceae bacterium]
MPRVFALMAWLVCLCAQAAPAGYSLSDDASGPTCVNYSSTGMLAWSRRGGDWTDAKGELYGDKAFSSVVVPQAKVRQILDLDLTELVRAWHEGRYRNDGVLLRAVSDKYKGVVEFHSRETGDLAGRPSLRIDWADGSRDRLAPAADTFLDCSSVSSLGGQPVLRVSRNQSALLRFNLPKHDGAVKSATLYLVSDVQYAGGSEVSSFRAAPPYSRAQGQPKAGLAAAVTQDKGLENNPDVVFASGFENSRWVSGWSELGPRSVAETVAEDPDERFAPLSGKALRVRIPKNQNLGLDLRYLFASQGRPEPEEIYFRYYLRFGDDWAPTKDGGKLPGIAGTYGRAGWGMRKSDGYNGWSARGAFAQWPKGTRMPYTAIGTYTYHADQQDSSGDYVGWSEGPGSLLENNRWYCVEQYVKLNTPGQKDGVLRAWIDGYQVAERTNIRYRMTADLKIESVWLDVYHGGTSTAPQDMTLYIDNVVIARRYIGPMRP